MRKIYQDPVRFTLVISKASFALLAKLAKRTGKKRNALIAGMIEEALRKEFPAGDDDERLLPPTESSVRNNP